MHSRHALLATAAVAASALALPALATATPQAPSPQSTAVWLHHESSNRCVGHSVMVNKTAPLTLQECTATTPAFALHTLDGDRYRLTSPDGVNCVQSVADPVTSSMLIALTPCAESPTNGEVLVRWVKDRSVAKLSTDGGRTCIYPHATGVIPVPCSSVTEDQLSWTVLYTRPAEPSPEPTSSASSAPPSANPSLPPAPAPTITPLPNPSQPEPMPSVPVPTVPVPTTTAR